MTTVSSEIKRTEFLRVDAARAFIAAALLVAALGIGLVLDQGSTTGTGSTKATVSEQTISTTFLADTDPVRLNVMDKMNQIAPEVSPFVASSSVTMQVMRHMNSITSGPCSRRRSCVTAEPFGAGAS